MKIYDEGEWTVKKHSTHEKRRVWRKLYLEADINTYEIILLS
ncbi:Mobile element protein [Candidatus Enterovibrio altilux]|uniref:Mobile element protein n=1 Tax=Candidatus Enterovibrio altilux TaxID=1927128 RepID=A0A291B9L6_9GAMM|nr:Mobile element protein [Candidatus Enterovibrio luxaltus]